MMKRFRYMLANWTSGGELTRLRNTTIILDRALGSSWSLIRTRSALQQIIACDTPNSNGTVKRMVRIAREGLE